MYKELIDEAGKTTKVAIKLAEERVTASFSSSFIAFCLEHNGVKFNNAEIKAKESKLGQSLYEVREFWPIEKIGTVTIEYWDYNLVAFAEDSCGNFFVFHKSNMDAVYFLDHETDEKELVSDTFSSFLSNIVKSDYSNLPKPKNAKVWINPAFLKKQKDLGNA